MSENNKNQPSNWADRNDKPTQWGSRMSDNDRIEARRRRMGPQVFNIIGAHLAAIFLVTVISYFLGVALANDSVFSIARGVSMVCFIAMLYFEGWYAGDRDINMMNYGHIPNDKYRGLKCVIIAEIPGLILAILSTIHGFILISQRAAGVDPVMQTGLAEIIPYIFHGFYSPFAGILVELEKISPLLCLVPVFIPIPIYHVAYRFGMKHFRILDKLVFKKEAKK